ncbi:MAG: type I-G CRISPR-associated protein Csb2 [Methylobacter sp.]
MFSLGIRYLNGWAMAASDGVKKERAEWPPHPDRVFMALAAAWFETEQDNIEKTALRWLETLNPPKIGCSDANYREVVDVYVPVNDTATPFEKEEKLAASVGCYPLGRKRRDRRFPVAIPDSPVVHFIWMEKLPDNHREALTSLSRKVTSVGHSASLVQMWIEDSPPEPNWIPVDGIAKFRMRIACEGRLEYLEKRYNRDAVVSYCDLVAFKKSLDEQRKDLEVERKQSSAGLIGAEKKTAESPYKERITLIDSELKRVAADLEIFGGKEPKSFRPEPGLWQGYGKPETSSKPDTHSSIFDSRLIVLKLTGKRLSLPSTLKLTQALRGALLANRTKPIPEWLCGHAENESPSLQPHIALLPMPFVGTEHADGRLLGVALALPRNLDMESVVEILEPWLYEKMNLQPRKVKLFDGHWLECTVELDTRESPPWNLQTETWARPANRWASVTPVVLDRHFDGPDKWEKAAESVKDGCERIGLPRPLEVFLHPVSMFEGVPRSNEFPWMKRKKDGGRMHQAHAVIVFDREVQGPVLVGAGRFRGYGFCRPLPQEEGEDNV